MRVLLAIFVLAALPNIGSAIEQTCAGCIDSCCEWSLVRPRDPTDFPDNQFVLLNSRVPPPCAGIASRHGARSWEFSQCQDAAYRRCLKRNCSACAYTLSALIPLPPGLIEGKKLPERFGVSGTKPVALSVGQVTVVETKRGSP